MTITRIGPLPVATWHEPSAVTITGPVRVLGGQPISAAFVLASRVEVERLVELVNNRDRQQQVGEAWGVLEWVEADGALERWRGWWVIASADMSIAARQHRRPEATAYAPIAIEATHFGPARLPVVVATHLEKTDDFGLTGVPLVVAPFPLPLLDPSGVTGFSRTGFGGVAFGLYPASSSRRVGRLAGLDTDFRAARPALVDAGGVDHFGPTEDVVRIRSATLRVTPHAGGFLVCEAILPGLLSTWTRIGTLAVYEGALSTVPFEAVRTRVLDEQADIVLMADLGHMHTLTLRHGDLGVRVFSSDFSRTLEWRPCLVQATGTIAYAAGKYGNGLNASSENAPNVRHDMHREFEGTSPVTICGWYKPDIALDPLEARTIFSLHPTSGSAAYKFLLPATSLDFRVERGGASATISIQPFLGGDLIFCALRYDGATLTASVKIAGGSLLHASVADGASLSQLERLWTGSDAATDRADGVVDNLMVFNRALTDTELGAIAGGSADDAGITAATAPNLVFWATYDGALAYDPPAAISGNVYLEDAPSGLGIKRFLALVKTAQSTDLANGRITLAADREALFGYEPEAPASSDAGAEQGKQLLFDRSQLLTLE